jgi:type II secretory ATPase GspE/PulE/Tfp pilus assembly ATPase PilB-like protein
MIGEIRDKETGEMALKASLTGHLILSTLHTQNVFTAISRLINLGLESHLIATSILLIQSQRLVRKLCPHCKIEDEQALEKIKELKLDETIYQNKKFYKSSGCEECNSGYRGRIVFEEVLVIDDEIRKMIEQKRTALEISRYAEKININSLQKNGVERALEGITSLDEIIRVC